MCYKQSQHSIINNNSWVYILHWNLAESCNYCSDDSSRQSVFEIKNDQKWRDIKFDQNQIWSKWRDNLGLLHIRAGGVRPQVGACLVQKGVVPSTGNATVQCPLPSWTNVKNRAKMVHSKSFYFQFHCTKWLKYVLVFGIIKLIFPKIGFIGRSPFSSWLPETAICQKPILYLRSGLVLLCLVFPQVIQAPVQLHCTAALIKTAIHQLLLTKCSLEHAGYCQLNSIFI